MTDKTTKAAVPPPPRKSSFLPDFVAPTAPADNMTLKTQVDMNFRVPREFRQQWNITAEMNNITAKELLYQAFAAWREKHAK